MSIQRRSPLHPVADPSRRHLLGKLSLIGLFAIAGLWSPSAVAAEPAQLPQPPAPPAAETYEGPLAGAYLVAPLLALAIGAAVFEVSDDETAAVAVGALSFFAPAAVHAYHGAPEQAGASVGTMLGLTLLGTLVGGVAGYIIGDASCDDDVESDCDLAVITPTFFGMFAGGVGGYIGNAIYDVTSNAVVPEAPAPPPQSVTLRLWLRPTRADIANRSSTVGAMSGLKVGATVHF